MIDKIKQKIKKNYGKSNYLFKRLFCYFDISKALKIIIKIQRKDV